MSKFWHWFRKKDPTRKRVQVDDFLDNPPSNRHVQVLLNQRTRGDDDFPDFVSVVRYYSYQTEDGEWEVDIQHRRYEESDEQ